ncbi:DUF6345 domain-containing protein [Cupriavidus sp. AcVe19-1a]|uniref:DUF6345 domain-containing protein n=1 Tax=Cupriavidus sp. AcVe19-1a TaxID=2821359 RepID=UPI001AE96812|nr:DUF6345 domain-containing protein [Cupriavidus sp. AcVe19-1a]MBP0633343.1 hypothetical protein [Cupriavidus sp. AcVe19-1a]
MAGTMTPKLSFATTWINTFNKSCSKLAGLKRLDYCNDIAEGFGWIMEKGGHKWELKHKQNGATPADWVHKGARADKGSKRCSARGDDARPGRGIDTVDFAIVVTHGGRAPDVVRERGSWHNKKMVSVFFNVEPCRFCSHKTRFGDGKLKWLVIDSCYSLEIDEPNGYTPASIWKDSFYGLHTIFGFTGQTTDAWWVKDRGTAFAFEIFADSELAEAWIDSAFSLVCGDRPVAATAGRNLKDVHNRMETERISSSFDSIPYKEVNFIEWKWRS